MRLLERIEQVYAIGDRVGYSPEEDRAHELAAGWMREAGLAVEVDAAGNLIGTRGDARVWTGSHLDSVPNGGRYDGALGVLAGIEAAERIDVPIGVVAFRDEERGFGGSLGLVRKPDVYVEVHIEQGPVLLRREEPLGVVSAIVGLARGEVVSKVQPDMRARRRWRDAATRSSTRRSSCSARATQRFRFPAPSRPSGRSWSRPALPTSFPSARRQRRRARAGP